MKVVVCGRTHVPSTNLARQEQAASGVIEGFNIERMSHTAETDFLAVNGSVVRAGLHEQHLFGNQPSVSGRIPDRD
jgi:hypothetical protein